jgi:hypothetical protein
VEDENADPRLIAEQLKHMAALLRSQITAIEDATKHNKDFIEFRVNELEKKVSDHETRIRTTTELIPKQKAIEWILPILASGLAIIAFIKSWLIVP